jgi:hypothetical protein
VSVPLSLVNLETSDDVSGFSPPDRFVRHIEVPWRHGGSIKRGAGLRSQYTGPGRQIILIEAVFHGGLESGTPEALVKALEPLQTMTVAGRDGYPPPCLLVHAGSSDTVVIDHLAIDIHLTECIALVALKLSVLTDKEKLDRVSSSGLKPSPDSRDTPFAAKPPLLSDLSTAALNAASVSDVKAVLARGHEIIDSRGNIGDVELWFGRFSKNDEVDQAAKNLHGALEPTEAKQDLASMETDLKKWLNHEAAGQLTTKIENEVENPLKNLGLAEPEAKTLTRRLRIELLERSKQAIDEACRQFDEAIGRNSKWEELKKTAESLRATYSQTLSEATTQWTIDANYSPTRPLQYGKTGSSSSSNASLGANETKGPVPTAKEPESIKDPKPGEPTTDRASSDAKGQDRRSKKDLVLIATKLSVARMEAADKEAEVRRMIQDAGRNAEQVVINIGAAALSGLAAKRSVEALRKQLEEIAKGADRDALVKGVLEKAAAWESYVRAEIASRLKVEETRLGGCLPRGADAVRQELKEIIEVRLPRFVEDLHSSSKKRLVEAKDQIVEEVLKVKKELEQAENELKDSIGKVNDSLSPIKRRLSGAGES